jgi:choline dehydrogenase-like flavoprotein
MTRPTRGFPPCHYCGNCGAGCDTASFFNSADHLLPFALQTGRLEIRSNAVVARILTDATRAGERRAVLRSPDRRRAPGPGQRRRARRQRVDSTRILLNSKSRSTPTASATDRT